jgi:hypothetical protein
LNIHVQVFGYAIDPITLWCISFQFLYYTKKERITTDNARLLPKSDPWHISFSITKIWFLTLTGDFPCIFVCVCVCLCEWEEVCTK